MKYGNIWKHGNIDTHEEIQDVIFTGNHWVAVGLFGRIFWSRNGKTWTKDPASGLDNKDVLFGIAYDKENVTMVAVGRDKLITVSKNGNPWRVVKPREPGKVGDFYKVAFGNNMFLTISEEGEIWKSTDGENWAKSISLSVGCRHIAFGNGLFMIATVPGRIFRSGKDGKAWENINVGGNIKAVYYDEYRSIWLAVGNGIWISQNNGANWKKVIKLSDFGIYSHLYCVTSTPETYIAAGEGGLVLTSDDGMEWRKHKQFTRRFILGMAFGKSILAAVGTGKPRNPQNLFKYSTHYSFEGGTPPEDKLNPLSGNAIEIISPSSIDKELIGRKKVLIKWIGDITFDEINLKYYNGSRYVVIEKGIGDKGFYTWTVPNLTEPTSSAIMIEGLHSTGNAVSYSSNMFTILPGTVAPKITLTAPAGKEILKGGTNFKIKWKSLVTFDKIDLEYYDGSKWIVIQNDVQDNGEYSWSVPDIKTDKAKIWIKGWSSIGNPADRSEQFSVVKSEPEPDDKPGTINIYVNEKNFDIYINGKLVQENKNDERKRYKEMDGKKLD